ncbi:type I-E CRISPR-associated protein Cas6/Cse3/CasE [Lipingzhangella sp. LS1_29]|uniref:Type I-E CRISPR-associated protein Cas6/Cse3/CasE n=1 Tax=Lipingzhangella rawalii TaxID=2055835 RepID=A0ABU2H462_9ACTN|nr:type I-E CRISPR-associated protein Cas6/Cse3/CasE [Lipingzhangella rawalii]MDS1269792.1 type I-E CRISPR-associated protein Cas6/Cse3/CasE [Lipingzhangella rawalii]
MAVWLTRITPDPRSAEARADLAQAGNLHRRLMKLLPPTELGDSPRQAAGLLFRVEESRSGTTILAQSTHHLVADQLPDGYGQLEHRELTPLLEALEVGRVVRYRIVASPTKRLGRSKQRGVSETTIPLRGPDADAWWYSRARNHGLEPRSVTAQDRNDSVDRSRGRRIRHAAVQFQGVATVTDPASAREAVLHGIGRGKSHGCGLLSLALAGGPE